MSSAYESYESLIERIIRGGMTVLTLNFFSWQKSRSFGTFFGALFVLTSFYHFTAEIANANGFYTNILRFVRNGGGLSNPILSESLVFLLLLIFFTTISLSCASLFEFTLKGLIESDNRAEDHRINVGKSKKVSVDLVLKKVRDESDEPEFCWSFSAVFLSHLFWIYVVFIGERFLDTGLVRAPLLQFLMYFIIGSIPMIISTVFACRKGSVRCPKVRRRTAIISIIFYCISVGFASFLTLIW